MQKQPGASGLTAIYSVVGFQNIDLMCRVLGVSRQGYYHYRRNTETRLVDPEHQEMLGWVKDLAIYAYEHRTDLARAGIG